MSSLAPSTRMMRTVIVLITLLTLLLLPATAGAAKSGSSDDRGGPPAASSDDSKRGGPADDHKGGSAHGSDASGESTAMTSDTSSKKPATTSSSPKDTSDTSSKKSTTTASSPKDTSDTSSKKPATSSSKTTSNGGGGGPEKCISYYFKYRDGDVDKASNVCVRGFDVAGHNGVVLHVSCSDTFPYDAAKGGHVSDGASQLVGHVIEPQGWWILRENGRYCGFPPQSPPPPPPPSDPVCQLTVEVREDSRTGSFVPGGTGSVTTTGGTSTGTFAGSTDWGTVPCGAVSATLSSPPGGYQILVGTDSTTITSGRGTLILTVTRPPSACTGPLMIEVRHADTGAIVAVGGATAVIGGSARTLDADGRTAGGSFDCGTPVAGTLTSPPAGYTIVGATSATTVKRAGGLLVFTVRQSTSETPCTGPLEIKVIDVAGELVAVGGAVATINGSVNDLDDDGVTPGGSYVCGTRVEGTLDRPPLGYVTVDGDDATTVTEDGAELVFVVEAATDVGGVVVTCRGDLVVRVVTTAGEPIDGAKVEIGGQLLDVPNGELALPDRVCGPITGELRQPPGGWNAVPPERATVTIVDGETSEMTFVVDQAAVLGGVLAPPAAPAPSHPAPSALARTGADAPALGGFALVALLAGAAALGLGRAPRRRARLDA